MVDKCGKCGKKYRRLVMGVRGEPIGGPSPGDVLPCDDHINSGHCSDCCDEMQKSNDRAFRTGWSIIKGGVKGWLHDMVYEVKDLVENQQSHPMEAARFVAEQNDPTDRKLGRLLFAEYVRMSDEGLI